MTAAERCTELGCRRKAAPGCFIRYHFSDGPLSERHAVCQKHYDASAAKCPPRQPGSVWAYYTLLTTTTGSSTYTVSFPLTNLTGLWSA